MVHKITALWLLRLRTAHNHAAQNTTLARLMQLFWTKHKPLRLGIHYDLLKWRHPADFNIESSRPRMKLFMNDAVAQNKATVCPSDYASGRYGPIMLFNVAPPSHNSKKDPFGNWRSALQLDLCKLMCWTGCALCGWANFGSHTQNIHVTCMVYLITYIWLTLMVNVGKYTIHGSHGIRSIPFPMGGSQPPVPAMIHCSLLP